MNRACVPLSLSLCACVRSLCTMLLAAVFLRSQRANALKQGCRIQLASLLPGLVSVLEQKSHQTAVVGWSLATLL